MFWATGLIWNAQRLRGRMAASGVGEWPHQTSKRNDGGIITAYLNERALRPVRVCLVLPKPLEPIWRECSVTRAVLNVPMAEISL